MRQVRVVPKRANMTENEFRQRLKRYGMTLREACCAVFNLTAVVLDAEAIEKHLQRHGTLSAPYTATFELLFSMVRKRRGKCDRKAA